MRDYIPDENGDFNLFKISTVICAIKIEHKGMFLNCFNQHKDILKFLKLFMYFT